MVTIRPARPEEAAALTLLCLRSKSHWGYDAGFMQQAATGLTLSEPMISAGQVLVAERGTGCLLGVAAIARLDSAGAFDLALLFVEPTVIRTGVGRTLFDAAVRHAARQGARHLSILADPFAEAFYQRLGAVRIGEAPSDSIPGRVLPLLRYAIPDPRS